MTMAAFVCDSSALHVKEYEKKFGSEFANGFLKGALVGEIAVSELYECLEREEEAVRMFVHANEECSKHMF